VPDTALITGVIAPLAIEARTARPLRRAGWRIAHSGVGGKQARAAALSLLAEGAERLLVWGTAGALVPELRPGTLIVPCIVRDESGTEYPTDSGWREALRARVPTTIPCRETLLVSVTAPAASAADKRALMQRTGAAAVDMEAATVAAVAAERGIPFAVLRAIADPLELTLPRIVLDARCDRLLPLEIPLRLIMHPRDLPALRALAQSFDAARYSLTSIARHLAQATN
jgi:hypothetical protein